MTRKKLHRLSAWQELYRDWNTLKSLCPKQRLIFLWDYYRWRILACVCIVITISAFVSILWEGQKPCRLRVCVVLNTEDNCSDWFSSFTEKLCSDGQPGAVDINLDQIFDYDNQYFYVQEIEIMTTISSGRMDAAVCGKDLYSYLLALNACLPLDQGVSKDLYQTLFKEGKLIYDTANLAENEHGDINLEDGIGGYYAVDLSGSRFEKLYNQTGTEPEPLYMVIISNTGHLKDCEVLIRALTEE